MSAMPDVPFIALTTLGCVLMIGLGFFPHPSRTTALWSFAFILGMLASFALLVAELRDSALLRAAGSGVFLPANAFLWSGLRAASGRRRSWWQLAAAYLVLSPAALLAAAHTDLYSAAFRVDFAVSAVFAVLIVVELVRLYGVHREALLPLIFGAALFPVFAVYALIDGALQALDGAAVPDDLAAVRGVNSIGTGVYAMCAVITLLLVARHTRRPSSGGGSASFDDVARARLERARAAEDEWWSVLDVRLDDPADIRTALGTAAFDRIVRRYHADVLAELPADADIDEIDGTRFVALVPRSQDAVRRLLVSMLQRVSEPDPEQPHSVRVSASIGWAPAQVVGHDLDALRAAAAEANAVARQEGGDRWERIAQPCAKTREDAHRAVTS